MPLHGKNLIGAERSAQGRETWKAWAPAQGQAVEPPFAEATPAEADRAMELAAEAFPAFRRLPAATIAAFLERIGQEIVALGDELLQRASLETALPIDRLTGERGRTVGQLNQFAALVREGSWVDARIDRAQPDRKPLPKPDVRRMRVPMGPVVVFGASNFPLAFSVAGGDTASALAAACPVVMKANKAHPGTSELVGEAIRAAAAATGVPAGVFSLIQGGNRDLGARLVKHPAAKAVGFTGSFAGGKALLDAAMARPEPIPVYAEMGSVNPVFLLPGALAERGEAIAEGLKGSVTMGQGQFCTKPGVVLAADGPGLAPFLAKLNGLMGAHPAGTLLHKGIHGSYESGVKELGGLAKVAAQGVAPTATQVRASVFETDAATFLREKRLREEVFGPATLVVKCGTLDDLLKAARAMEGNLTATLHGTSKDLADFAPLVSLLETKVGRLVFNGFPTGVEVCPSMTHGGPWPATTDAHFTSVGTAAIERWVRPLSWQNFPQEALPAELRNDNPRKIWRLVDGQPTKDGI
jgi:alpha-ketoglutaric semialdehyde dehydrogenase